MTLHRTTPRLWLLLAFSTVLLAAPAAMAVPPSCMDVCTFSAPCDTVCWFGYTTTCGDEAFQCDDGGSSGSCSCSSYVYGTSGSDSLWGNSYNNCIYGGAGDDTLYGEAGGDWLFGEGGNDTLYGGSGDDCLVGGAGSDHLDGGTGVDTCTEGETYVSC